MLMLLTDVTRILKPGGILALSTMHRDNVSWLPDIRSTFATFPFQTVLPDPFPTVINGETAWSDPDSLEQKLLEYGFRDIKVRTVEHIQHIESAEHFFDTFKMMLDWLTQTYWTPEQRDEYQSSLGSRMTEHLREKYSGEGWDLTWTMILATCQTASA
jgi:SAM-dependent methyltransferase